jgi:hypothetical protein
MNPRTDKDEVEVPHSIPLHPLRNASRVTIERDARSFAFSFEALAIVGSVCFRDFFNASTEEVHMKIHSTNSQKSMLCTAAAGNHALLG